MKKGIQFFFLTLLLIGNTSFAEYYGSHAVMTGVAPGQNITFTNPYTNAPQTSFSGLINGTVDGRTTLFYNSDLRRILKFPNSRHANSEADPVKINL